MEEGAEKVYVSDYFEEWGKGTDHDLGQLDEWTSTWTRACDEIGVDASRMQCEHQDMTKLTYEDDAFDVVFSTSVIEHLHEQTPEGGDITAMREMIRVCKSGGLIALSTDVHGMDTDEIVPGGGTWYYSIKELYKRLIDHPELEMVGPVSFDVANPKNDDIYRHNHVYPCSAVVFVLRVVKRQ